MKESNFIYSGYSVRRIDVNTLVVGGGAAGWNAVCRLAEKGVTDCLLITEDMTAGASLNTGSDKQTYYKMSISGSVPDSPAMMAEKLFSGGAADGDIAYSEAALSLPAFFRLCTLGVPFPQNRLGEYAGYRTDNDELARATTAGPLTSQIMTKLLRKDALSHGVQALDKMQLVKIITVAAAADSPCGGFGAASAAADSHCGGFGAASVAADSHCGGLNSENRAVCGAVALDTVKNELVLFSCKTIILATGGDGGIYKESVYPHSQHGANGIAYEAGAAAVNLTEWQYGIASLSPRWNLSGSYMQVLPRFVSRGKDGTEKEFLTEYFPDIYSALGAVFLKGYEWPFDSEKVNGGSSAVDMAVYAETKAGRTVFLDFTKNPFGTERLDYSRLPREAADYLKNADIDGITPVARLKQLNEPAYKLYKSKGTDLENTAVEIAVCAQHMNGGIEVNLSRESDIKGLYCIGECAGTHGIRRPGGSALNAGQTGAVAAADDAAAKYRASNGASDTAFNDFDNTAADALSECERYMLSAGENSFSVSAEVRLRELMSLSAAAVRSRDGIEKARNEVREMLRNAENKGANGLRPADFFRFKSELISAVMCLEQMKFYLDIGGASRGGAYYLQPDSTGGGEAVPGGESGGGNPSTAVTPDTIIETVYRGGECKSRVRKVRPLPEGGGNFEKIWKEYRGAKG